MNLYEVNPLTDDRWTELLERSERSSVFHTRGWLLALQRTYGYEPVVFTDAAPGHDVSNALVFCRINSWMTGRRLVSLPFSDHCDPLVASSEQLRAVLEQVKVVVARERWNSAELRPRRFEALTDGFAPAETYCTHVLDLRPEIQAIFSGFHKSCVQRAIHRAEREGVDYEVGRSESLVQAFYALNALTRRKYGLPVQPVSWFRNLVQCLDSRLAIYLARHRGMPIAALLFVTHRNTVVYKYGCSDFRYKRLGATPLLFWVAIQEARKQGISDVDLGRSDWDNPGLIGFKEHLGARRGRLSYFRYSLSSGPVSARRQSSGRRKARSLIPTMIRDVVGSRLYRHFG